jgi:hypothetical protein
VLTALGYVARVPSGHPSFGVDASSGGGEARSRRPPSGPADTLKPRGGGYPWPWMRSRFGLLATLTAMSLAACGGGGGDDGDAGGEGRGDGARPAATPTPAEASGERARAREPSRPELPRGGRDLLPRHRIVALYGAPQAEALGRLGQGSPEWAADRAVDQAGDYKRADRPVMPALQLIATIANAAPGEDGKYRTRQTEDTVRDYLRAAREEKALLILDIQPGRARMLDEVRHLEQFLTEPDVSLAIDPEWHMDDDEVPGEVIGNIDAKTINDVSGYLDDLVREHDLPEKALIVHRFTEDMIVDEPAISRRENVALVEMADGFGAPSAKRSKYGRFTADGDGMQEGFKLFYEEDTDLMSVDEVLDLSPPPDVVVYE